jgi:hypothetical protein
MKGLLEKMPETRGSVWKPLLVDHSEGLSQKGNKSKETQRLSMFEEHLELLSEGHEKAEKGSDLAGPIKAGKQALKVALEKRAGGMHRN